MSNSEFSESEKRYREAIGLEAIRRLEAKEPIRDVAEDIMAYLREVKYGLTDEEYDQVAGAEDGRKERLERLDTAVNCIVLHGTLVEHSPAEALRSQIHKFSERTWLERLTSGMPGDFEIVINEIDEALTIR